MGLDMYLSAERYLSDYQPGDKAIIDAIIPLVLASEPLTVEVDAAGEVAAALPARVPRAQLDPLRVDGVTIRVGYWRKANAIHQWFVTNCQDGIDECQRASVTREDLEQLRAACLDAAKSREHAAELLPTQPGFFFGSTEYDDNYLEDLALTVATIDRALTLSEADWDFFYRSSW